MSQFGGALLVLAIFLHELLHPRQLLPDRSELLRVQLMRLEHPLLHPRHLRIQLLQPRVLLTLNISLSAHPGATWMPLIFSEILNIRSWCSAELAAVNPLPYDSARTGCHSSFLLLNLKSLTSSLTHSLVHSWRCLMSSAWDVFLEKRFKFIMHSSLLLYFSMSAATVASSNLSGTFSPNTPYPDTA